jgi:two-component system, NarL family, uhpT operon response regulator UhpA
MISDLAGPVRIKACLAAGAASYLPKSEPAEEILRAVSAAAKGQAYTNPSLAALLVEDQEERTDATPTLTPRNCAR